MRRGGWLVDERRYYWLRWDGTYKKEKSFAKVLYRSWSLFRVAFFIGFIILNGSSADLILCGGVYGLVWVGRWSSQLWSGLDSGGLIYLWTFSGIIGACIASPFLLFIRIFIIISTRWIQMVSPIVAVVAVVLLLILLQTRIIVCEVLLGECNY